MKRLIKSSLLVAGLSLMLTAPVYGAGSDAGKVNTNKAGTYNATGTGTSYTPGTGIYGTTVPGTYNTGTNRMYTNNDGFMNGTGRYGVNNFNGNGYRTTAADRTNGNWGWLGLLGLIGLAGMRGRNTEKQH